MLPRTSPPIPVFSYPRISKPFFFIPTTSSIWSSFRFCQRAFAVTVCFHLLFLCLCLFFSALTLPHFAICAWSEMCLGFDKTLLGCRWVHHPGMSCFEPVSKRKNWMWWKGIYGRAHSSCFVRIMYFISAIPVSLSGDVVELALSPFCQPDELFVDCCLMTAGNNFRQVFGKSAIYL